jgi:D-alanyl-D-alanine dipeptidase
MYPPVEGEFLMDKKEMEEQIINNYKQDEQMMILVFAQWCVNHDLDPTELYLRAYPKQASNHALQQAIDLTVPKEEAGDISDETLLGVLSLFDNEDLAFIISEEISKQEKDTQ